MQRRLLLLALLPLAACAELRTPRRPISPPPGLLTGPDQGRQAIRELDESFRNGGAALRGHPERMARAAAMLEWLCTDLAGNPRWNPVAPGVKQVVYTARDEVRNALGIQPEVTGPEAATVMADVARELADGQEARAQALLEDERRFRNGGERVIARLRDPGPLPNSEIALGALAQEVARLDSVNGWVVSPAADPSLTGTRGLEDDSFRPTPGFGSMP